MLKFVSLDGKVKELMVSLKVSSSSIFMTAHVLFCLITDQPHPQPPNKNVDDGNTCTINSAHCFYYSPSSISIFMCQSRKTLPESQHGSNEFDPFQNNPHRKRVHFIASFF